jgi:hypothetical protein
MEGNVGGVFNTSQNTNSCNVGPKSKCIDDNDVVLYLAL